MSTLTQPPSSAASGLHGIFLSFPVALFSTALAADAAYLGSAEIQWTNFASWAIAGALVFTGLTVLFALAGWLRHIRRPGGVRRLVYLLVLAALFAVGLVNAFHHAQDGWSSVGPQVSRSPPCRPFCARRRLDVLFPGAGDGDRAMTKALWTALLATLALSGCEGSDPALNQTGAQPDLPAVRQTLVPPMNIATPTAWNGEVPTVPQGFTVSAFASDLSIPRQMLVLPNGDVLVAEGRGGMRRRCARRTSSPASSRSAAIRAAAAATGSPSSRDADNNGQPEVRTVLIDDLDAPYGLALVDGFLYVAEQGRPDALSLPGRPDRDHPPGEQVTKLPVRDQPSLDEVARGERRRLEALCRHRLQQQCRRAGDDGRGGARGGLGDRPHDGRRAHHRARGSATRPRSRSSRRATRSGRWSTSATSSGPSSCRTTSPR